MKKIVLSVILTLALCGQSTASVHNDEGADSLRHYSVDDVVVTATRTPVLLKNSPVITRVISAVEMERQGIATLETLLERELAGVEFHQAGYGTTMSFQGLDARYVLFLVDGERIAGETYGNIDYTRIPLSTIERIEIVRGASSVLYGSSAMGAVVNIITRMPQKKFEVNGSFRVGTGFQSNKHEELGTDPDSDDLDLYRRKLDQGNTRSDLSVGVNLGKFRSLTSFTYRTVDAYKLRGTQDEERLYKAGDLTYMKMAGMPVGGIPSFVAGGHNQADTIMITPPDQRGLAISGWRDWYVGHKMDYTPSEKFRFELSGNYTNKNRYDFKNSIMDDNPMSGIMPGEPDWAYEKYQSYNVRAMMEHSPNEHHKVYLSFLRDESLRDVDSLYRVVHKQRHTYNIPRLLWTYAGKNHRLTTGIEMINEQLRFDLNPNGYDEVKSLNTAAMYLQDEIWSDRKLSFVVGVRGDWSNSFGWMVTPKASAKFVFGDFAARFNYSNGYRSPSLKEMYMEFSIPIPGSPTIKGNPDLKAEKNHYFSLSLDYNLDWINASVSFNKSYFRNKIDVLRMPDGEDGKQVMVYDNIDKSQFGSVEFITRIRLARDLYFSGNYNYVFQSDNAPDEATQYIFPSPHTATAGLDYSRTYEGYRFSLGGNLRYVGPKDYEDFMSYIELEMGPGGRPTKALYITGNYTARHEGYAVFNLALTVDFPQILSLTFGVDNVFGYKPKIINFNSAVLPGTNGFLKAGFRF